MFRQQTWASAVVIAVLALSGCGRGTNQDQAKLEETQRQLEETRKQLEAEKAKAEQAPANTPAEVPPTLHARSPQTSAPKSERPPAAPLAPAPTESSTPRRTETATAKPPEPAPPRVHTIPAGTSIAIRTVGRLSSKDLATGAPFEATLAEPIVIDGYTVAKRGANVDGTVTQVDPGGRVKGVASLSVGINSITGADGRKIRVATGSVTQQAKKSTKKDAVKVGIGAGIGAAIGAIAGGGKGAAIGAGAGAAGGTGVAMATRGDPAEIPSETVLTFRLREAVTVQEAR